MSDPIACHECRAYYLADRDTLVAACASVGIEYGKSTGWMLRDYLTAYHDAGHDENFARPTTPEVASDLPLLACGHPDNDPTVYHNGPDGQPVCARCCHECNPEARK